jgi:hypothetical protein
MSGSARKAMRSQLNGIVIVHLLEYASEGQRTHAGLNESELAEPITLALEKTRGARANGAPLDRRGLERAADLRMGSKDS